MPQAVQFTPESSRLTVACGDGRMRYYDVHTGLLVHETAKHGWSNRTLQFAPDGQHILTRGPDYACIWPGLRGPAPAPAWLAPLAEAVAGRRLNAEGEFEPVPVKELLEIKQLVQASDATDSYTRWAKWFFADRLTRPQSLAATRTVAEHVQSLIDQNTPEDLREALRYSPTNREAFARLARVLRATPYPERRRARRRSRLVRAQGERAAAALKTLITRWARSRWSGYLYLRDRFFWICLHSGDKSPICEWSWSG